MKISPSQCGNPSIIKAVASWRRIPLEKLQVAQLLNKYASFLAPEISSQHTQQPVTGSYQKLYELIQILTPQLRDAFLVLSSHQHLGLPKLYELFFIWFLLNCRKSTQLIQAALTHSRTRAHTRHTNRSLPGGDVSNDLRCVSLHDRRASDETPPPSAAPRRMLHERMF